MGEFTSKYYICNKYALKRYFARSQKELIGTARMNHQKSLEINATLHLDYQR